MHDPPPSKMSPPLALIQQFEETPAPSNVSAAKELAENPEPLAVTFVANCPLDGESVREAAAPGMRAGATRCARGCEAT